MVIFADTLAKRGFDVVRYDPAAEGDSGDLTLDADQWAAWTSSLVKVTEAARELTGAKTCVLFGLRIGATVARVAAEAAGADGLVLLDPMAKGAAWIQELIFWRAMFIEPAPPESAVESLGLRISHATKASLETLDLATLPPLDIPCLYASPIKNDGVIRALGAKTDIIPFKGYASFFKEGHVNAYPEWTFDQVREWLESNFVPATLLGPQVDPAKRRLEGDGYAEEPVVFGADHIGTLTLPLGAEAHTAVLIGNTGADPRSGPGNFSTFMARTLARRNIATLRIDFDGLGESDPRFGLRVSVYDQSRTETFQQAADFMAARGFNQLDLVGLCTGGYHALHALFSDPRFSKVMIINAWLVYSEDMQLDRQSFLRALRSKFMDAQPDLATRVDPLIDTVRALIPAASPKRPAAPEPALPEEIHPVAQATFDRINGALQADRKITLLMGHRDPSRGGLARFGTGGLEEMLKNGMVQHLEAIDHGLFALDSQKIALARIVDFLQPAMPESAFAAKA
jgi:pimeloyl-ACP methyl ester carboxylesterase